MEGFLSMQGEFNTHTKKKKNKSAITDIWPNLKIFKKSHFTKTQTFSSYIFHKVTVFILKENKNKQHKKKAFVNTLINQTRGEKIVF